MKYCFILILSLFFLISCTTIIQSEDRASVPGSIELGEDIILSSTGAININVPFFVNHVDFLPASFRIDDQENVIYIDPVGIDNIIPADYIFITHAHPDHLYLSDINKILKEETMIICPPGAADKLSDYKIIEIRPGEKISLDNINCEAVPSYNIKSGIFTAHPESDLNVGYILTINGLRIYHAGDTDVVPEISGIRDVDVALVPIDGDGLTMSTEQAADFINSMNPEIAAPMHYEILKGKAAEFRKLINNNIEVVIFQD